MLEPIMGKRLDIMKKANLRHVIKDSAGARLIVLDTIYVLTRDGLDEARAASATQLRDSGPLPPVQQRELELGNGP